MPKMTKLSVNVNKIATLRNARGENTPDLVSFVEHCESFGAQGITVHPRPDERHVTLADTYNLAKVIQTEYNIEGYPDQRYLKIISDIKPDQATLVPDAENVLTSNAGWDTIKHKSLLIDLVAQIKECGSRVSIFVEPNNNIIENAKEIGADRIEFYTGPYAYQFLSNKQSAIDPYIEATLFANSCGLKINAGHDLNLLNLSWFVKNMPFLDEVSIGHALMSDALYYGIENSIQMYLKEINKGKINNKN